MIPIYFRRSQDLGAIEFGKTTESLVLDFKRTLDNWRLPKGTPERDKLTAEAQRETCRDIAQFANTDGGCLLIGVCEQRGEGSPVKVAVGIRSVDDPDGMKQWIEQAIRNYLVPATFSHDIAIIHAQDCDVLAVNVLPSPRLVTLWDVRRLECVRRTSHGKDWMNPDEMERHVMNASRAPRLELEAAMAQVKKQGVHVAGGHWIRPPGHNVPLHRWTPAGDVTIGQLEESWFELRVPNKVAPYCVNVPFAVLRTPWVGADGRLNLLLSVRLVLEDHAIMLEPY